jgi:hypothetical protein
VRIVPIPGFHALEFKDMAQARVQAELDGLAPGERATAIRRSVMRGPLGNWWRELVATKKARALAALSESGEQEVA